MLAKERILRIGVASPGDNLIEGRNVVVHDLIGAFTGNDIAYPPSGIWYISCISRDQWTWA